MSFVNLSRVRQQQAAAAAAAEAARLEAQAAAEEGSSAQAQPQTNTSGTPPAALSPSRTATSGISSPPRAPAIQSLLVRRHNTVGGKPQRQRSVKRVEEEEEEEMENADSFDGHSVAETDHSTEGLGSLLPGANLTRHGSLPARTAPYPISPVRSNFSSASRPRFGTHRSSGSQQDHYESIASVTGGGELNAYGAEDDEEWERALREGRRNGGATGGEEDFYDADQEALSSSAPRTHSTLHHQRSLPHQRSLNFINSSSASGSRSPPLLPPHQYHLQQQSSGGRDFFPSSDQTPPTSPTYDSPSYHQRSTSHRDPSTGGVGPTIRRHQSLTQAGVHSRLRNESDEEAGGRRLGINELPPPTSPVKRSPWNAPHQDLLSRQRSWEGEQGGSSSGGPISPVPGSGSRWRRDESGPSSGEGAMSAEQLQNAFDAISLGRSMAASTNSLQPPPPSRSAATSPDPYNLPNHSRSASATNSSHSLNLHPPQHGIDRGRHSRSPSLNPQPPRFASPSPGPSTATNTTTPTPPDGHQRPAISIPSFPHHRPTGPGFVNNSSPSSSGPKLSLITDANALAQGSAGPRVGPQSAAAYVPPVGHSTQQPLSTGGYGIGKSGGPPVGAGGPRGPNGVGGGYEGGGGGPNFQQKPFTAMGTGWEQKHNILGARPSYAPQQQQNVFGRGPGNYSQQPPFLPPVPQSFGQQGNFLTGNGAGPSLAGYGADANGALLASAGSGPGGARALASPVDVASLAQAKGYNPVVFDTNPPRARFFVIKSYTEDDVAKSLKFEIWSSTTFGNKRLDKAFKESAAVMPIYLFFSVNSSGHFAGVAQMLTEVDYNTTSTVWAQDKWKGIFRLRWIFVKDVPNQALRHIRLNNVPERKPVTNSRDTQELLPEAGLEMLKIFHSYQSRTSLLQDYAFYESTDPAPPSLHQPQPPLALPPLPPTLLNNLPPFPAQPTHYSPHPPPPPPQGGYHSSAVYQQPQQRY